MLKHSIHNALKRNIRLKVQLFSEDKKIMNYQDVLS